MLRPQLNEFRCVLHCSDFWKFKVDKNDEGEKLNWFDGFESNIDIAVPGSWNEILEEEGLKDYIGSAWYSSEIFIPNYMAGKRVYVWLGSADYNTKVWINGKLAGKHTGGFLPFWFDITKFVELNSINRIIIKVNNKLTSDSIPQGVEKQNYIDENRMREETHPSARFDFFPYGGIHRQVVIYSIPEKTIEDITINTSIVSQDEGGLNVNLETKNIKNGKIRFFINAEDFKYEGEANVRNNKIEFNVKIENCRFWSPEDPFLYNLNIELFENETLTDQYKLLFGVREIRIDGNKLLLNNKEIFLRGFGKHEDFSVIGKALSFPVIIKDFSLLKWINANSFRTSHYPYAEEILDLADKRGLLIIDEVPAVSLDFRHTTAETLKNHKNSFKELYTRDKNHPSVISWAMGNEPNLAGEKEYLDGRGKKYWKEVFDYARTIDTSRPFTVPNCPRAGNEDPVFDFSDYISLNRYYGWYENPGQIELGCKRLSEEMDFLYNKYKKPILITEFGADTLAGNHSTSDQMFTEEYQAKFIEFYCKLIESKTFAIGEHIWNFADFRTPQIFRRVVNNLKGVFTRNREPKLAAFKLKEHWGELKNKS